MNKNHRTQDNTENTSHDGCTVDYSGNTMTIDSGLLDYIQTTS